MNTTALINEAYLKLAGGEPVNFENRTHFFATAAKAMRQVLINYAEQQRRIKRGGDAIRVTLDDAVFTSQASAEELLKIHQLLTELERQHPRRSQIVECRVFGGMQVEEVAEALSVSASTVKREWRLATTWLYDALANEDSAIHNPFVK
jgi:RNA polymerase sigma factor (TIGR02999 family)